MAESIPPGKRELDELVVILKSIWRNASAADHSELAADADRALGVLQRYAPILGEIIRQQDIALIASHKALKKAAAALEAQTRTWQHLEGQAIEATADVDATINFIQEHWDRTAPE